MQIDTILFAAGRFPNVKNMRLEAAGIEYSSRDGIYTDKYLRTTNKDVYAVGDCIAMATSPSNADLYGGSGY